MQSSAQKCSEIGPFFRVVHTVYARFVYQRQGLSVARDERKERFSKE
jgi:hypothetical protein